MKQLIPILILLFVIMNETKCQNDRWQPFAMTKEGDIVYYDNLTIDTQVNYVELWYKYVYNTPETNQQNYKLMEYLVTRIRIYCNERKYEIVTQTIYYVDGSSEKSEIPYHSPEILVPDTINEGFYNKFCNK